MIKRGSQSLISGTGQLITIVFFSLFLLGCTASQASLERPSNLSINCNITGSIQPTVVVVNQTIERPIDFGNETAFFDLVKRECLEKYLETYDRDCVTRFAIQYKNIAICNLVSGYPASELCVSAVAKATRDSSFCYGMESLSSADSCISRVNSLINSSS